MLDTRVTAASPPYDEGKPAPLSLDRGGNLRVAQSGSSYVLLNNATANGNGTQTAKVRKDRYGFYVENYGTGTATVTIQQLGADGSTWVGAKDSGGNAISFSVLAGAPGAPSTQTKVYDVMQDSILRAVVSSVAGSVSLYMTMG